MIHDTSIQVATRDNLASPKDRKMRKSNKQVASINVSEQVGKKVGQGVEKAG
jgi:hypothetical protein